MVDRITIVPGKRSGQPCNPRFADHRLGHFELARGRNDGAEILDDYPELEPQDFRAVYEFAARVGKRVAL